MLKTLFYTSVACHGAATAVFLAYLFRFRSGVGRLARGALWLALIAQLALVGTALSGASAVEFTNLEMGLHIAAATFDLCYLLLAVRFEVPLLGALVAPISTALLLTILFVPAAGQSSQATQMVGVITYVHIGASILGFVFFTASFAASLAYLLQDYSLRTKRRLALTRILPPLARLERVSFRMLLFGFPVFTVGLILGTVWVGHVGVEVFLRPQVLFPILAWIVFGVLLQMYSASGWRGTRAAILNIVGYLLVLQSVLIYALRGALGA